LSSELGIRVSSTLLFSYPTLKDITEHMIEVLGLNVESQEEESNVREDLISNMPDISQVDHFFNDNIFLSSTCSRKPKCRVVLFSGFISRPELLYKLGLNLNLQEYDVHIFTIAGRFDRSNEKTCIFNDMIYNFVEEFRDRGWIQESIPLVFVSFSFGATIALEFARKLSQLGKKLAHFVSISGYHPVLFEEGLNLLDSQQLLNYDVKNDAIIDKVFNFFSTYSILENLVITNNIKENAYTDCCYLNDVIKIQNKEKIKCNFSYIIGKFDSIKNMDGKTINITDSHHWNNEFDGLFQRIIYPYGHDLLKYNKNVRYTFM
jgi:surfactin synthase thioesterase subunit